MLLNIKKYFIKLILKKPKVKLRVTHKRINIAMLTVIELVMVMLMMTMMMVVILIIKVGMMILVAKIL